MGCGMSVLGSCVPCMIQHKNGSAAASPHFLELAGSVLRPRGAPATLPGTPVYLRIRAAVAGKSRRASTAAGSLWTCGLLDASFLAFLVAPAFRWSRPCVGCGMSVLGSRVPSMIQHNTVSAAASLHFLELAGSVLRPRGAPATLPGTPVYLRIRAAVAGKSRRASTAAGSLWTCGLLHASLLAFLVAPAFRWSRPCVGCGMSVLGSRVPSMIQHNTVNAAATVQFLKLARPRGAPKVLPGTFVYLRIRAVGRPGVKHGPPLSLLPAARKSQCQTSQSRFLVSSCVVFPSGHELDVIKHKNVSAAASPHFLELAGSVLRPRGAPEMLCQTSRRDSGASQNPSCCCPQVAMPDFSVSAFTLLDFVLGCLVCGISVWSRIGCD